MDSIHSIVLYGENSVHLAALTGHVDVLDALLSDGCSVELTRATDQRTALHLSAAEGHLSCCQLLIEREAQLNCGDSTVEQLSPLDLALLNDHHSCVVCLLSNGARTSGGLYHRAVSTVQLSWKFHVHKRRMAIARRCSALVLQQAL